MVALPAIYPVVDATGTGRDTLHVVRAVIHGGACFFQLRLKGRTTRDWIEVALAAQALATDAGARMIVNDRADIARFVGAAGVHVGQDDLPPEGVREMVGSECIVGLSTHNMEQLRDANCRPVDYVAYGPVFPTDSKEQPDPVQGVDVLCRVRRETSLPLVAIGGIGRERLAEVLATGADSVAVIAAICRAPDPEAATRDLLATARALQGRSRPRVSG